MMDIEPAANANSASETTSDEAPNGSNVDSVTTDPKAEEKSDGAAKSKKKGKADTGHAKRKKKGKAKGATPATQLLEEQGHPYALHTFQHDPANSNYGLEAASRLEADPRRIFKTLIVDVGGTLTAALIPVPRSLDLRALASALGVKRAEIADPADAERASGYRLGAISPLGLKQQIPVIIDLSAADEDFFLISGGRRGLELELRVQAVIDLVDARLAPITR